MTTSSPPATNRAALARRLRDLRRHRWPGRTITQRMLAEALGGFSPTLVSGWENEHTPTTPPPARLYDYATFFATDRSIADGPRRLTDDELTPAEVSARDELYRELFSLRIDEPHVAQGGSLRFDWRFPDGEPIRIVCGKLDYLDGPAESSHPYTDGNNLNYTDVLTYADADALIELFGHLRMVNPESDVRFLRADRVTTSDELRNHVVFLGGIGLNSLTKSALITAGIPLQQVEHPAFHDKGEVFTVAEGEQQGKQFLPRMADDRICVEDVGLLVRARNPNNPATTLTICDGVFARGVLGAVRILTDASLRHQNEQYLAARFAGADRFAVLMRVPFLGGSAMTPDLKKPSTRLFEWSHPTIAHDQDVAS
jgi:hypothetical protein